MPTNQNGSEFVLHLLPAQIDRNHLPTEGTNRVIVADVRGILHFRIFDGAGALIVDRDETELTEQARQLATLRQQLPVWWPLTPLPSIEQERVINTVLALVAVKPFAEVLHYELRAVRERRIRLWISNGESDGNARREGPPPAAAPSDACCPRHTPGPRNKLDAVREKALNLGIAGLAFSGGGIRSGAICLGFLQGLASVRLLRLFDYLSTVSGGGYAGAWLAAWVCRENERLSPAGPKPQGGLANVELQLDPSRVMQAEATRFQRVELPPPPNQNARFPVEVIDQEPEPVHHVRAYSNYLTPRPGVFSTDTWTLLAIYLRNTLVNLLILLSAILFLIVLSRVIVWGYKQAPAPEWLQGLLTLVTVVAPMVALGFMLWNRAEIHVASAAPLRPIAWPPIPIKESSNGAVFFFIIMPIVAASGLAPWTFGLVPSHRDKLRYWHFETIDPFLKDSANALLRLFGIGNQTDLIVSLEFVVSLLFLTGCIGAIGVLFNLRVSRGMQITAWRRARVVVTIGSAIVLGTILGILCSLILGHVVWNPAMDAALQATVSPPLFMAAFVLAGFVDQWVFGKWLSEYEREWRSRVAASMLMAALVWLGFFGVTLYLPLGMQKLGHVATGTVIAGWVSTVIGGVFAARSPRSTPAAARPSVVLRGLARVGPAAFLVGVLALLSLGLSWVVALAGCHLDNIGGGIGVGLDQDHYLVLGVIGFLCLVISVGLALVADVNLFSLHSLYGNRLIRCFLAASRRKEHENQQGPGPPRSAPFGVQGEYRQANGFTGFDAADDMPLCALRPPTAKGQHGYDGPYPIFNTALNLVASTDLAFRDRLAASFALTPDYCGSEPTGYVATPTNEDDKNNLTVGRAMTISGAAADPNMPLQSPAQVALLTIVNARLGWWLQNPRQVRGQWKGGSPTFGVLGSLFRELLGRTNATGDYIHLSDGGHFDNSGVYELIRRRCRFVVAVDAASDTPDASENLANMVRQVRTDLGIRIVIDPSPLRINADGLSTWHVAVGTICYDDVDEDGVSGILFVVRASLTGDEPADLRNYVARDSRFPHHSTADQFFDETRFESYRNLGNHLATSVFGEAAADFDVNALLRDTHQLETRRFFAVVRNRWFPPPPDFNRNYLDAGKNFADLTQSLRTDPNMNMLLHDMYPEIDELTGNKKNNIDRAEMNAIDHILDVMEMAWLAIDLNGFYAHPMHSGWMGTFRRWASSDTFQRYWPILRGEYSKDFVRFCERILNLPTVTIMPERQQDGSNWTTIVARVNQEFLREWASILTDLDRFEQKRKKNAANPCTYIPIPSDLVDAIQRAMNDTEGERLPLVWFLNLAETPLRIGEEVTKVHEKLHEFPVGVFVVYPVATENPPVKRAYYEAVLWIRGAYRSLGFGRQLMENRVTWGNRLVAMHELIRLELADRLGERQALRVVARYPITGDSSADRLQQALWMNFFYDYDFRRVQGQRTDRFLVLQYVVDKSRIEELKHQIAKRNQL